MDEKDWKIYTYKTFKDIFHYLKKQKGPLLYFLVLLIGQMWIKKLRKIGIIKNHTVILDPDKLGLEACFFVLVRTSEHEKDWQDSFLNALLSREEVLEAHRLAGDIDYILKVRVRNAKAYDEFYQALISEVKIFNVTALLSMEEIKSTQRLSV